MDLERGFVAHVLERGFFRDGDTLLLGCSGGLDSCVLAHLLRFSPGLPRIALALAHFDHRMRPGSEADAFWVQGLARAWDIPAVVGAADPAPASEAEARTARYAFLAGVRESRGARWLLTAHHADDQAETVLFRILRGTGLAGLRGIRERGAGGVVRPLLPFRREQLEAYAEQNHVPHRADPTNLDLRYARNAIRQEILPRAEASVAPGARRSLLRLARLAAREEAAWQSLFPELLEGLVTEQEEERVVMARPALLGYHPFVRERLLRELVRRMDGTLDEAGTRAALEFTSSGASGRRLSIAGGLILAREFDRLVLSRQRSVGEEESLEVAEAGEGGGRLALDGRSWRAEWTHSGHPKGQWTQLFAPARLHFPLRLRGWIPGDRIRMRYGSKKLKKLFAEARVPVGERSQRPVLVDAKGAVLWVPGLACSVEAPEPYDEARLIISVTETDPA